MGIETSCDETAASVVELTGKGNLRLFSNEIASSLDLHAVYGGVVPEIAARSHLEHINPVVQKALFEARNGQALGLDEVQGDKEKRANRTSGTRGGSRMEATQQFAKSTSGVFSSAQKQTGTADSLWDEIDAIAVTQGPGLGGSLMVGVLTARTLSIIHNKPLYGVNHVEAHVYASFITEVREGLKNYTLPSKQPQFPLLALIVSGGHSQFVLFEDHFKYRVLGRTLDDAIGEAFDKVAKIIGLPYPGGPSIEKSAKEGDAEKYKFPKAKLKNPYDFSFSGLKTAVLRTAQGEIGKDFTFPSHKLPAHLSRKQKVDIAASFQKTAFETLAEAMEKACREYRPKSIVVAGGVAASQELRKILADRLSDEVIYPDIKLCTDNAAMIAANGAFQMQTGKKSADPYSLEFLPNLHMRQ